MVTGNNGLTKSSLGNYAYITLFIRNGLTGSCLFNVISIPSRNNIYIFTYVANNYLNLILSFVYGSYTLDHRTVLKNSVQQFADLRVISHCYGAGIISCVSGQNVIVLFNLWFLKPGSPNRSNEYCTAIH